MASSVKAETQRGILRGKVYCKGAMQRLRETAEDNAALAAPWPGGRLCRRPNFFVLKGRCRGEQKGAYPDGTQPKNLHLRYLKNRSKPGNIKRPCVSFAGSDNSAIASCRRS